MRTPLRCRALRLVAGSSRWLCSAWAVSRSLPTGNGAGWAQRIAATSGSTTHGASDPRGGAAEQQGENPDGRRGGSTDEDSAPIQRVVHICTHRLVDGKDGAPGHSRAVPVGCEAAFRTSRAQLAKPRHGDNDRSGLGIEAQVAPRPVPQPRVGTEYTAGTEREDHQPREDEHNVGAVVVGRGVPADGEEERQGQQRSSDGRDPRPQAQQGSDPDGELAERDQQADQCRCVRREPYQRPDDTAVTQQEHLERHRGRVVYIEVAWVRQLLQARIGERHPKEDPQRQQQPPRFGTPPKPRRHKARGPGPAALRCRRHTRMMPPNANGIQIRK